jgi:hypothetical protein
VVFSTVGDDLAVAVDAEGELGEVVGADGEAVEVLGEPVDEQDVVGDLAHRAPWDSGAGCRAQSCASR